MLEYQAISLLIHYSIVQGSFIWFSLVFCLILLITIPCWCKEFCSGHYVQKWEVVKQLYTARYRIELFPILRLGQSVYKRRCICGCEKNTLFLFSYLFLLFSFSLFSYSEALAFCTYLFSFIDGSFQFIIWLHFDSGCLFWKRLWVKPRSRLDGSSNFTSSYFINWTWSRYARVRIHIISHTHWYTQITIIFEYASLWFQLWRYDHKLFFYWCQRLTYIQ